MHDFSLWERLQTYISSGSNGPLADFLNHWSFLAIGFGFGLSVIILLLLLGKYFIQWGYERISVKRGRDSLTILKKIVSGKPERCEPLRPTRRQRRLVRGIRRRRPSL